MAAFVRRDTADVALRRLADSIVRDIDPRDFSAQARRIHEWIQKNIRYRRDPYRRETVADARRTLALGFGDCDDLATLGATLLALIGIPCRFAVCGARPRAWSHVWLQCLIDGRWTDADASRRQNEFGWTPPAPYSASFDIWPPERPFAGQRIAIGEELYEWQDVPDGLGFFKKIGRAFKKVGKGIGKGLKKVGKVALPVAAGFIPGVGGIIAGAIPTGGGGGGRAQPVQFAPPPTVSADPPPAPPPPTTTTTTQPTQSLFNQKVRLPGLGEVPLVAVIGGGIGLLLLLRK